MDFLSNENIELFILAYIIGGIPFGLILAKIFGNVDIRKEGSGNIGATNVLRVLKKYDPALAKKVGIATLVFDIFKGIAVLLVAMMLDASEATLWGVALLSVMGHCFSLFLWFEGGKGVATGFGVLAVMIPLAAVVGVVIWGIAAKTIKISSLSSLLGVIATLIASFVLYPDISHAPVVLIIFFIVYKHSDNIIKLIKGEEKRIV